MSDATAALDGDPQHGPVYTHRFDEGHARHTVDIGYVALDLLIHDAELVEASGQEPAGLTVRWDGGEHRQDVAMIPDTAGTPETEWSVRLPTSDLGAGLHVVEWAVAGRVVAQDNFTIDA